MNRPTIAVTVIAKNERNNIDRLTESLIGCFDQYILVDTGSTDGTIERAIELGWEVYQFEWIKDFSAARNHALQFVKTDYWFWCDLDDTLETKENFIHFRDNVMCIADIWVARYQYTSDAQGNSLCDFVRERVVKTSSQAKFKYFIHEGIIPPTTAVVSHTNQFFIKHHRTPQDLIKDKGRNIGVFEKHIADGKVLDPRMRFYYGKELFEVKRFVEAAHVLTSVCAEPTLELHDRILAMQYAGYALLLCKQYQIALQLSYGALQLAPLRAEFYNIISDAYIKLGMLNEALPTYYAASQCAIPQGPQALFFDRAGYGEYPLNQIATIYANQQRFDEAEEMARLCLRKYPNDTSGKIIADIARVKATIAAPSKAIPVDEIVITGLPNGPYKWDSNLYKERSMGGSETAAIEMSRWLTKLSGKKVIIFNNRDDVLIDDDGVEYRPTTLINEYMSKWKPYVHIAWRHNMKCTDAPTFVWCHDLFTPGGEHIHHYNKMMCLTPFHKTFVQGQQNIPDNKIYVTRNGINPERFRGGPFLEKKDPFKFVFSSSPDRGLDRAMLVLDAVRTKYPQIKLHVFYGIEHLAKYGLTDLAIKLKAMMDARSEWVIYHGATQQDVLIEHFKEAAYCVQPSDFIETSKITAIEMLLSGVYQITRGVGGCVDTLKKATAENMATLVYRDCKSEEDYKVYIDAVIRAMDEKAYLRINANPDDYSWESVAREWLRDLPTFF